MDNILNSLGGYNVVLDSLTYNLNWIRSSFDYNDDRGSSAYCNILGRWSEPYPETTGYIICTLLSAFRATNISWCRELAKMQIAYFRNIQNEDGSFHSKQNVQDPIVFDTSQILLGLTQLYKSEKSDNILSLIKKSYHWLLSNIESGKFINYNYRKSYNPSYYARVYWAMLEASDALGLQPNDKVVEGIEYIRELQNENFSFEYCGFNIEDKTYLTHTIAYTIRGLWECGRLLENTEWQQAATSSLDVIAEISDISKSRLGGTYDKQWKPDTRFSCNAGNAQLVVLAMRINPKKYSQFILSSLRQLLLVQKKSGKNMGAIPSSTPIWGSYQRWRYTNWTQKFFADALCLLLSNSTHISHPL